MLSRRYKVVDVFSAVPLAGNPVAVVFDADDLNPAMMQAIARWTNLSETTFLLAPTMPGADYRLRIFTPLRELPFAGHPTLGSAHAALEAGLVTPCSGRLVQQCEVGLVPLSVTGDDGSRSLSFELPKPRFSTLQTSDVQELEVALGEPILASTPPAIIDVGAVWLVAQLPTTSALLALRPDFPAIDVLSRRLGVTGLSLFAQYSSGDADIEVRSFAPSCGVDEDPVCGSGNGSVAVFRRERGHLAAAGIDYLAAQGQCLGRSGRVAVRLESPERITIGGACLTTVAGTLRC